MAKQTVKPENAPAKIRALREEIVELKASMGRARRGADRSREGDRETGDRP
jgi:hypothetical protein